MRMGWFRMGDEAPGWRAASLPQAGRDTAGQPAAKPGGPQPTPAPASIGTEKYKDINTPCLILASHLTLTQ